MKPDAQEPSEQAYLSLTCPHMDFTANVTVNRLEDSGLYSADVTIQCAACGTPFHFNGLKCGLDLHGAAVSVDGLEARLSIAPGVGGLFEPGK